MLSVDVQRRGYATQDMRATSARKNARAIRGGIMEFEKKSLNGHAASRTVSGKCSFAISGIIPIAAALLACLFLAASLCHAQGVGTSGQITGTVTDAAGSVVPKATVEVVDIETGGKRTATTNDS